MEVHGSTTSISHKELDRVQAMIQGMYEVVAPIAGSNHDWIFGKGVQLQCRAPYHINITWLDHIKRLYPEEYSRVQQMVQDAEQSEYEEEMHRLWSFSKRDNLSTTVTVTENS